MRKISLLKKKALLFLLAALISILGCGEKEKIPSFSVTKYPYNARSGFWFTSDDLNPALYMTERPEKGGILKENSNLNLLSLKWMGEISRLYKIPISYGFTPKYAPWPTKNKGWVIADFTEPEYKPWLKELKSQIDNKLTWVFVHGLYHGEPRYSFTRPPSIAGYENADDWLEAKNLIKENLGIESITFRSPYYGYRKSEGWTKEKFTKELKRIGFKIYLDAHSSGTNEFGYDNGLFAIGTYIDTKFQEGALERVKKAYKNGDFQQESCPYIYVPIKRFQDEIRKVFGFVAKKGINKNKGIWCPYKPKEIKDWYETIYMRRYNITVNEAAKNKLNLTINAYPGYETDYFSLILINVTSKSRPRLNSSISLTKLEKINNQTYVATFPITSKKQNIIFTAENN